VTDLAGAAAYFRGVAERAQNAAVPGVDAVHAGASAVASSVRQTLAARGSRAVVSTSSDVRGATVTVRVPTGQGEAASALVAMAARQQQEATRAAVQEAANIEAARILHP
jgi:hypothetical protein